MNRIPILLALFTFVSNIPVHAMHKEKSRPCCSLRTVLRFCTAASIGCICATVGLSTHHAIVGKIKADCQKQIAEIKFDYEYPCLEIAIISSTSIYYLDPPACNPDYDVELLRDVLRDQLDPNIRVKTTRVPCKVSEPVHIGFYKKSFTSCTHDVDKALGVSTPQYHKKKTKFD